jgi:hypothetical protein
MPYTPKCNRRGGERIQSASNRKNGEAGRERERTSVEAAKNKLNERKI